MEGDIPKEDGPHLSEIPSPLTSHVPERDKNRHQCFAVIESSESNDENEDLELQVQNTGDGGLELPLNDVKIKHRYSTYIPECDEDKIQKHQVAVIESSDSGDENCELKIEVCTTGDGGNELPLNDIQIKNRHCTVIPECEERSDHETSSNMTFQINTPKFNHRLDWNAWTRKKALEERRKKKEIKLKPEKDDESVHLDENKSTKDRAWVHWMRQKKYDEKQKMVHEHVLQRLKNNYKMEREKIAQEQYKSWCLKKQHDLELNKKSGNSEQENKMKKNFSKNERWEEWCLKKKSQRIPKRFTHDNYPKPTWVNPEPWKHPTSVSTSEDSGDSN